MKRTVLVSGGNRGIGLAIVESLAAQLDDILLLGCRNIKEGQERATSIGHNVHAVELDLSKNDVLHHHISSIMKKHGRIDVLINNAGVLYEGDALKLDESLFYQTMQINAMAAYELMRACLPGMIENNYGRIVNMSSGWGSFAEGLGGPFSYSVSKATLNALTHTLARQVPDTIKINAMCPGWVRTDMGGQDASRSPSEGADTAIFLTNLHNDGPSGRFFRDRKLISW